LLSWINCIASSLMGAKPKAHFTRVLGGT